MSYEKNFIRTIQDHTGIISGICKTYFPESDDFKDARQDVILQLWRSFPTFRGDSKISTWIYKLTLSTILTKRKKDYNLGANEPLSQLHLDHISCGADLTSDFTQDFFWLVSTLEDCDRAIIILLLEVYQEYSTNRFADGLHMIVLPRP